MAEAEFGLVGNAEFSADAFVPREWDEAVKVVLQSDFGHATPVPVNGSPSAGTLCIAPTAAERRNE
jgi:hypothetical protein